MAVGGLTSIIIIRVRTARNSCGFTLLAQRSRRPRRRSGVAARSHQVLPSPRSHALPHAAPRHNATRQPHIRSSPQYVLARCVGPSTCDRRRAPVPPNCHHPPPRSADHQYGTPPLRQRATADASPPRAPRLSAQICKAFSSDLLLSLATSGCAGAAGAAAGPTPITESDALVTDERPRESALIGEVMAAVAAEAVASTSLPTDPRRGRRSTRHLDGRLRLHFDVELGGG